MKRIVSKTTKNYLTIFSDDGPVIFMINIDNNYIHNTKYSINKLNGCPLLLLLILDSL